MEIEGVIKALAALLFVCGLLLALSYFLRKYNLLKFAKLGMSKNISIDEIQYLDQSRKMVLVSHKNKQYLLLLGHKELLLDVFEK